MRVPKTFLVAAFAYTRDVLVLFRPEFVDDGVVPLRLLAVATAAAVILALTSTYLKLLRRHRATSGILASAAVAQALLLVTLVPRSGAAGAATAYTVSMCGMYGVFAWFARRAPVQLKPTRAAP
jgi:O-antigen/teichoic acid export membrane protein